MGVLICLYDWSADVDWGDAQAKCEAAMARIGRSVERYVYGVEGKRERVRKTRWDNCSAADLRYLDVFSFDGGEMNLPTPHASAGCYKLRQGTTFHLFEDAMAFDRHTVADLAAWVAEIWGPCTGQALAFERKELPETFPLGMGNAYPPKSTEDTTAWLVDRREVPAKERKKLRDLFEINILCPEALARVFGDHTLEAWIAAKPERGTLRRYPRDAVIWTVEAPHLEETRDEARNAGITYPRDPHRSNWETIA